MTKTVETTIVAPALANGATGKASVHCRRSLDAQRGKTKPKADPAAQVEAPKAAKPKAVKAAPAPKVSATGLINSKGNIVLKANKEVRAALTAKAKELGASRYAVRGFADSAAFLNGFAFKAGKGGSMQLVVEAVGQDKTFTFNITKTGAWVVA